VRHPAPDATARRFRHSDWPRPVHLHVAFVGVIRGWRHRDRIAAINLVLATVVGSDAFGERASPRAKDREWIIPRFPVAGFLELTVPIAGQPAATAHGRVRPR
jgi:hypothetical protein